MAPGTEEDIKPTMSAVDAGAVDTGAVDTGTVDIGTVDTGVNDISAVDIGALGTGPTESAAIDTGDAGAADGTTITSEEKVEQINGVEETHQSTNGQVEEGETTTAAAAATHSGQGETTAEQLNGPITSTDQPTASAEPNVNPEVPSDIPPTSDAPLASPHSTPPPPTPPTTRSKTLPSRRPATPAPPSPPPAPTIRRGVMTLSDVLAAKHVLAEKANAHWAKGLGGGQNKESETIVNFLYKMKVGPGTSILSSVSLFFSGQNCLYQLIRTLIESLQPHDINSAPLAMIPSHFFHFPFFCRLFLDLPFILFVCFFSPSYSIHNLHLVGIIIFASLQEVMYVFMLAHFYKEFQWGNSWAAETTSNLHSSHKKKLHTELSPFFYY